MKKRILILALLTALLTALLMTVFAAGISAVADEKLILETHTYWAGTPTAYTVFTTNLPEDAKLISIKSSKPKVLKADKWGSGPWDATVIPLKPGKSTVTVVYSIDGKKVTVSGQFTVKKYPNAIKTLTLNGKTINLKKEPFEADRTDNKSTKITIKVTPGKGWKVVEPIEILSEGCSYKTVKNGKTVKISLKKPRVAALITLKNGADEEFEYFINLTE